MGCPTIARLALVAVLSSFAVPPAVCAGETAALPAETRPPRPPRGFLERVFFDGVRAAADAVRDFPQEVLDDIPFPGKAFFEDDADVASDQVGSPSPVRTDLYAPPEKVSAGRAKRFVNPLEGIGRAALANVGPVVDFLDGIPRFLGANAPYPGTAGRGSPLRTVLLPGSAAFPSPDYDGFGVGGARRVYGRRQPHYDGQIYPTNDFGYGSDGDLAYGELSDGSKPAGELSRLPLAAGELSGRRVSADEPSRLPLAAGEMSGRRVSADGPSRLPLAAGEASYYGEFDDVTFR